MSEPSVVEPRARAATRRPWIAAPWQWLHRHFVFLYLALSLIGYSVVYTRGYNSPPIRSDGDGYYAYLPAAFIHRDLGMRKIRDRLFAENPSLFGEGRHPGCYFDKYPVGEAVLMSPFFLAGDALTRLCGLPRDGYSAFYQHAAGLAGLFYGVMGMALLKKILDGLFSPGVTLAVLIATGFGTDLFHYGTYDSIFSHTYSFFLFCALVGYLPVWMRRPDAWRSVGLGGIFGMICLTRNPNALIGLYGALFVLGSLPSWAARLAFLRRNAGNLALAACTVLLLLIPQMVYWKFSMGSWLLNSYGSRNEHFQFFSPHLADVLFSCRKGLFVWSPLLLLAVAGLAGMKGRARAYRLPVCVFLGVNTYVISSWGSWAYGGSFGHRAFVESLVFFALGLGWFYASLRSRAAKITVGALSAFLVCYSVAAMWGYWTHRVPFDGATAETLRHVFTPRALRHLAVAVLVTSPLWVLPILRGGGRS